MGEQRIRQGRTDLWRVNGEVYPEVSSMVSSKQMRVKFLAINFELARWLHEVMRVVLCCGSRGRPGEPRGLWYYICTETIGRKCVLLTSPLSILPQPSSLGGCLQPETVIWR